MTSKITVSLPFSLLAVLDRLAKQWATTRSGAVAELLRRVEQEETKSWRKVIPCGQNATGKKPKRSCRRRPGRSCVNEVRRGDVFLVDFNPARGSEQAGFRPAVVVQNDVGNKYSPTVIVVAITTEMGKTYPW